MIDEIENNIFIPVADGLMVLSTDDIIYLESESNYTKVVMVDNIQTVPRTLKHFEDKLPQNSFVRIHNSFIINIKFIKAVTKIKTVKVLLKNNVELPVSESRKDNFFELLEKIAIML